MRKIKIISPCQFIEMPWRNGLGTTTELVKKCLPDSGSDDFIWRLSMANVAEDGEFSKFEGYDRSLLLLSGSGLALKYDNGEHDELTEKLQMARFKGDCSTIATLLDGPVTDFNVMTRRNHCRAEVTGSMVAANVIVSTGADTFVIYATQSPLQIGVPDAAQISIPAGCLAVIESSPPGNYWIGGCSFIAVQIFHNI